MYETIINTIPSEIDETYADSKVSLLIWILQQNYSQLSIRANEKEFSPLLDHVVFNIEKIYT